MPDNIPPPKPNPSRDQIESQSRDALLQQQALEALVSHLADTETQFLSNFQRLLQEATQAQQPRKMQDYPVTVFPAGHPQASETASQVQRVLEGFRKRLWDALPPIPATPPTPKPPVPPPAPEPPIPPLPPPPLPPIPPLPPPPQPPVPPAPELPELTAENAALIARFLNKKLPAEDLLQALAPKPPPFEPPASAVAPPPPAHVIRLRQEQVNLTGRSEFLPGHGVLEPQASAVAEPPPADIVRRRQAMVNATGRSEFLPGHGVLEPEAARSPLVTLGARLQTSPRTPPPSASPVPVVPPVGMPQPDLGALAARMLQTVQQATPALPGGLAARMMALAPPLTTFPEAIPVAPSTGISPLAGRLADPLQQRERRQQQAENETLARQTQEAMRRAQEEDRYQAQRTAYNRLETPLARAAYEAPLRDEMRQRTAGYQQEALQSRIEARTLGGPESQAMTAALVQAQAQAQTNQLRQQAQVAQAQATYAAAPEGRQQIQEQLQARQQTLAAQEARQRAEAIAQYGRLSVALGEVRERLGSFGGAVSEVAGKGLRFGGVGLGMANVLGGMASPQMAGTVQESMSLLGTRMGRSFLPLMETEARVIQGLDRRYQELEKASPRAARAITWGLTAAAAGWAVGGPIGAVAAGGTAALAAASGAFERGLSAPERPDTEADLRQRARSLATWRSFLGQDRFQRLMEQQGANPADDISRSWRGLPMGQTMGGFEYAEMVQQSGLNISPMIAEQERLQLENVVGLLQQVADNTRNLPNIGPAWR